MLVFVGGGRVGANPGYKEIDEWLHKKNFPVVINEIKSTKQFKGLDLIIEISENKAILIEDKTYTKEHSNQLKRYYEEVAILEKYIERLIAYLL
ncbi:hypothetical protein bcere0007_8460 [Bacillus mycoides]|nr:hypothetical protein bcere0007_8460 [Bacillus mycoides]